MKSLIFLGAIIANGLVFGQETGRTLGLPSFFSNGNGQPELTYMKLDNLPDHQQGFSISNNRYTSQGPMEWTEEQKAIVRRQEEFRRSVAEANKNGQNLRQEIIHPEEMVVQQLPESNFNHNNFNTQNVPEFEKFRPSQPFDEPVFTRPPPPPPAFMPLKTEGVFRQNVGQNAQFQTFVTPETPTFTQLKTQSQRVETFVQPQTEKPRLVLRVSPISSFKNPELSTFIRTDAEDFNFGQKTQENRQRQNFNFQNQENSQNFQEPVKTFNDFQNPQENHNVQVPVRQANNFQTFRPEENVQFVQNQPLLNTFKTAVNQKQEVNVPVFNEQPETFSSLRKPIRSRKPTRPRQRFESQTEQTFGDLTTPLPGSLTEDEINRKMAESAKYSFQSAVADSINDNTHIRQETRDGLSLKGLYSYSDGYFKRTVHYVADENGYRVIKEESEPIGTGPVLNPAGQVDVSTSLSGSSLQYSLKGENLPKHRTSTQKFREQTN